MTISRASHYRFLDDSFFKSEARGVSDIIDSLCGRTRHEFEILTGQNPFPSEQFASKLNPQREHGHDHSGPPWGTAFLHPIAWMNGMKSSPSNRTGDRQAIASLTSAIPRIVAWPFYNRRFAQSKTPSFIPPYSRCFLAIVASLSGAGSVTLTVKGAAAPAIQDLSQSHMPSQAFTVASTSEVVFTSSSLYFTLAPKRNFLSLVLSSSASSPSIIITAMALLQVQKRSH